MRQGSRHGVPRTGGAGPPKGRTWPLPLETPKLGRGARRARRGSPINTKRGGCASPKDRICTGWHPRFPQETAAGSYKTFTASSPQRKKIRGWVRSDRGGTSCLKGLRLPCKAQGSPLHIRVGGMWALLSPLRLGGWELRAPRGINRGVGASRPTSVEGTAAALGATQTWDLVVLQRELVIVGDLFIHADGLLGINHDLLLGLNGDHLGIAVGLRGGGAE